MMVLGDIHVSQELFHLNFTVLVDKVRIGQAAFAVLAGELERQLFALRFKCRGTDEGQGRQIICGVSGQQN